MRAVVYKGPFEVAVENVPDPTLKHPNDVIVKITSSCICGSDLHMYEGRTAATPGIVFSHENMGIIQEVGPGVKDRKVGDRVVVQNRFPPGHIRTPEFVRGKAGQIVRYYGNYKNPEKLAYGQDGLPLCHLYWVEFIVNEVWAHKPAQVQDKFLIDIYEHWLDPA